MMKYALYDYLPKRFQSMASKEQLLLNQMILDFKDGRNYATRWAAQSMAYTLQAVDLMDVTIVCIPASSQYAYIRRFKYFTQLLCSMCNAVNGFSMIHIHSTREKKHLSQAREAISPLSNACIDASIRGRKVLVIDDICTTCASADLFIDSLKKAGADVVMAMFLAKTRRCWS